MCSLAPKRVERTVMKVNTGRGSLPTAQYVRNRFGLAHVQCGVSTIEPQLIVSHL